MNPYLYCSAHRFVPDSAILPDYYRPEPFRACWACKLRLELWEATLDHLPGISPILSWPALGGYMDANLLSFPRNLVHYVTDPERGLEELTKVTGDRELVLYWRRLREKALDYWEMKKRQSLQQELTMLDKPRVQ